MIYMPMGIFVIHGYIKCEMMATGTNMGTFQYRLHQKILNTILQFTVTMAKEDASKDEQVGFHKGALTTLAKEREEMMKILSIVEQLMQMHIKRLQELGVDLQKEAQKTRARKPIEDSLK